MCFVIVLNGYEMSNNQSQGPELDQNQMTDFILSVNITLLSKELI